MMISARNQFLFIILLLLKLGLFHTSTPDPTTNVLRLEVANNQVLATSFGSKPPCVTIPFQRNRQCHLYLSQFLLKNLRMGAFVSWNGPNYRNGLLSGSLKYILVMYFICTELPIVATECS